MQGDSNGFLPNTLTEWLGAIAVVGAWVGSMIGLVVRQTRKEDKLIARFERNEQQFTADINGLGARVDRLDQADAEKGGRMARYEAELTDFKYGLAEGIRRLSSGESKIDGLEDHLTGLELRIIGEIARLGDRFNERDTLMRERVARLETFHKDGSR
jgi:hypothetical protein